MSPPARGDQRVVWIDQELARENLIEVTQAEPYAPLTYMPT